MPKLAQLLSRMATFNAGDPALTQHLLKVHGFCRAIGQLEGMDADGLHTLEVAALTHDIAIKHCMDTYGKCTGKMQEEEGPALARPVLESLGFAPGAIDRVCFLIGHHHTYTGIDGIDYQILIEADFLVNLYEGKQSDEAKKAAYANIFKTEAGQQLFRAMYAEALSL